MKKEYFSIMFGLFFWIASILVLMGIWSGYNQMLFHTATLFGVIAIGHGFIWLLFGLNEQDKKEENIKEKPSYY